MADLELLACKPVVPDMTDFNKKAIIPCGCTATHVRDAMLDFIDFLGFVNTQLNTKRIARLESMLMPANFSSIVGEFMSANIPKHCETIVKNQYHNGHPDLIPAGKFHNNAVQHHSVGIEIKASQYPKRWQGHNPEDTWLMVFVFSSNRPVDEAEGTLPMPFRFCAVLGAELKKSDWQFSGRSEDSRRTITASVKPCGYIKMVNNWICQHPKHKF